MSDSESNTSHDTTSTIHDNDDYISAINDFDQYDEVDDIDRFQAQEAYEADTLELEERILANPRNKAKLMEINQTIQAIKQNSRNELNPSDISGAVARDSEEDNEVNEWASLQSFIDNHYILTGTKENHHRVVVAFAVFAYSKFPAFELGKITKRTPMHIAAFLLSLNRQACSTIRAARGAISAFHLDNRLCNDSAFWCDGDKTSGNPTKSEDVRKIIVSITKKHASDGKLSQSVMALTKTHMEMLYRHLHPVGGSSDDAENNALRWAIYLLTFLCCFRGDEACGITVAQMTLDPNLRSFSIHIMVRKNKQSGNQHEHHLEVNAIEPMFCPVAALYRWLAFRFPRDNENENENEADIGQKDYIFRIQKTRKREFRRVTTAQMIGWLQTDLQHLNVASFRRFKSHSFRRGGAQYWLNDMGQSLTDLCHWGGWTTGEATQIFRYLYSIGDQPSATRFAGTLTLYSRKSVREAAFAKFVQLQTAFIDGICKE